MGPVLVRGARSPPRLPAGGRASPSVRGAAVGQAGFPPQDNWSVRPGTGVEEKRGLRLPVPRAPRWGLPLQVLRARAAPPQRGAETSVLAVKGEHDLPHQSPPEPRVLSLSSAFAPSLPQLWGEKGRSVGPGFVLELAGGEEPYQREPDVELFCFQKLPNKPSGFPSLLPRWKDVCVEDWL